MSIMILFACTIVPLIALAWFANKVAKIARTLEEIRDALNGGAKGNAQTGRAHYGNGGAWNK